MKTNFQTREQLKNCLTEIVDRIERRAEKISNRKLIEICGENGNFLNRDTDPHFCHEIAEAAINFLIKEKYAEEFFQARSPEFCTAFLKTLAARLPTQTWRSREQIIRQQFSTPPAIAYFLTYLLNLKPDDQILEPSAGTGSLAVWGNGLEIFDEGHKAKHAFADENGKATQTGTAVLEVQDPIKYPEVRVVYSSATAASEVRHLAYQIRLGLCGVGTSFPLGFAQFAEEIEAGGVGAMEMVCRDLKAMGRYFCGNLSYGIDPDSGLAAEYREVIHQLTPKQREMYNNMARAWQEVLKNFNRALDITNSSKISRRYVVGQFWAEHQRCFRNLITAFKVPTLIREIETALSEKQSVVVSITGTGEAQTKKQISRAIEEEEAIDDLDFSPRETLSRLVENCFPTKVFQEQTDNHSGTTVYVPVLDESGQQIESRVALELKRELLDRLSVLEIPEHPLDQLVNYFGTENVAEMTGRKKRLIKTLSGRLEYRARQIPGVPNRLINLHEKNCFQNKDKRIAIMSEVASTGDSLHASRKARNQQRRYHIAAELKWSADKQVQDFGRTHRTDQFAPPIYGMGISAQTHEKYQLAFFYLVIGNRVDNGRRGFR